MAKKDKHELENLLDICAPYLPLLEGKPLAEFDLNTYLQVLLKFMPNYDVYIVLPTRKLKNFSDFLYVFPPVAPLVYKKKKYKVLLKTPFLYGGVLYSLEEFIKTAPPLCNTYKFFDINRVPSAIIYADNDCLDNYRKAVAHLRKAYRKHNGMEDARGKLKKFKGLEKKREEYLLSRIFEIARQRKPTHREVRRFLDVFLNAQPAEKYDELDLSKQSIHNRINWAMKYLKGKQSK